MKYCGDPAPTTASEAASIRKYVPDSQPCQSLAARSSGVSPAHRDDACPAKPGLLRAPIVAPELACVVGGFQQFVGAWCVGPDLEQVLFDRVGGFAVVAGVAVAY